MSCEKVNREMVVLRLCPTNDYGGIVIDWYVPILGGYENGIGVSRSIDFATAWFQKAAEQGLAEAQFRLGVCCLLRRMNDER